MLKNIIVILLIFHCNFSKAQIISGFGASGGISYAREKWSFTNPTSNEKKNFLLGFNGNVFLEFFQHDYIRYVTELQFNQKGTIEKIPSGDVKDRLNYLSFNNYLKIRHELFSFIPYLLIGPRIEYLVSSNPQVDFNKLHVSLAAGAGMEFISFSNLKFFIEAFYNPDVSKAYKKDNLAINNTSLELRIGLKYAFKKGRVTCPPVYK